jgi:hypothetical protein
MSISGISSTPPLFSVQSASNVYASGSTKSTEAVSNTCSKGSSSNASAFMKDVMDALKSLGVDLSKLQAGNKTEKDDPTQDPSASGNDIGQALAAFLQNLQQALQNNGQPSSSDGDSNAVPTAGSQNGHGNFIADLKDLLNSLGNASDSSGASNPLSQDFSNLINALGGSSSGSNPSLQDFLTTMLGNATQKSSSSNNIGSIISTQV